MDILKVFHLFFIFESHDTTGIKPKIDKQKWCKAIHHMGTYYLYKKTEID